MTTGADASRRVEAARARFAQVSFARSLGVAIEALGPDHAVVVLPYRAEHMNAVGVLNGGASAALLTMAGALAAWTGIDLERVSHLGCVDLSVQYLARSADEDVLAEARVLRRGRDLIFLEVAVRSRTGTSICRGLLSYHAADYAGHTPRRLAAPALLPAPTRLVAPAERPLFRGYVEELGITPLHESPGRARLHMPCTRIHTDADGALHAGALASIVDIAAVTASWSLLPRRPGARGSTIGMQVAYPVTVTAPVVADAHVQQRSEELLFGTVHVAAADSGQLAAMGQVSYRLVEPWPEDAMPPGP